MLTQIIKAALPPAIVALCMSEGLSAVPLLFVDGRGWRATSIGCESPLPLGLSFLLAPALLAAVWQLLRAPFRVLRAEGSRARWIAGGPPLFGFLLTIGVFGAAMAGGDAAKDLLERRATRALEKTQLGATLPALDQIVLVDANLALAGLDRSALPQSVASSTHAEALTGASARLTGLPESCMFRRADRAEQQRVLYSRRYALSEAPTDYTIDALFDDGRLARLAYSRALTIEGAAGEPDATHTTILLERR